MRRFTHTFPQRISAFLLCLALCLGLLPVTALAAGEDVPNVLYVGTTNIGTTSYNDNAAYWTSEDGGTTWNSQQTQPEGGSYIYYDGQGTLELHNVTIQGQYDDSKVFGAGIYALCGTNQSVSLTIQLTGNNTITGDFGIYVEAQQGGTLGANASLSITGDGSLTVTGTASYGLYVKSGTGDASLTIKNASVDAKTTQTYFSYAGVCVQSGASATGSPQLSLAVNGGSLTASGGGNNDGIQFYVGNSSASATTSLTVSDNAIVRAENGITAYRVDEPTPSGTGIVFDGTEGTVYGNVELQEDLTIGEGESLTLDDGATLAAGGHNVIVDGGTLDEGLAESLDDSVIYKVTKVELNKTSLTLDVNESETLTATITPSNATNKNVNWESSDTAVATVDASGKVTATGTGTTNITVTTADGSKQATCSVTVTKPVTGVTLTPASLSLFTGDTATLIATVQPSNATNQNVTWQSDNANVATVEGGTVTAVSAGTATITVATVDGGKTATCAVTVEKPYTPPPYIPPSKPNWTSVARKLANAQPGDTVTVKMNGEAEVPGEVWETIAGRDVTVILDMGGNVSWTVDGNDVPTATHFADMDFGVDRNTTGIDVDVINAITGEVSSVQITLAHDGEFGFTLTLTAPLGRENAGRWANLYHYDEDAESLSYETSGEIQEDGTASLKMTHASQYAIIIDDQTHQLPFTDLGVGQWYETAVRYAYLHDIMEGMSATTFQPNGTLTRAMAVQIFYNLEGQPDISGENLGYPYEDVNAQAWYGDAVYWARITGVATGYGDGTFQPTDSITRQEFAQMLYNYAKYKGYDLTAQGDLTAFPDGDSVQPWAETAMTWANGNQLINGHDDGTLEPGGTTTRAQAAAVLMRFDQDLAE